MTTNHPREQRRLRSFVRRDGRATPAQERARAELWPLYGLTLAAGMISYQQLFGREAPTFLEIGYGTGQSLLALAERHPEQNFIGVETHKPGVGALMLGIQRHALTNLRSYHGDVVDILEQCIPASSLDGISIFFPDPWQKRRHHERRLIQAAFVQTLVQKLKPTSGLLHLATDWEDYSKHMLRVLSQEPQLLNVAGELQFSARSPLRPITTKFERRAEREGRKIWDLAFVRRSDV